MLLTFLICAVMGYLIGSIPFGLILTKWIIKSDIRNIGSGNIGATNVLRTGNIKLALLTLILDVAKGLVTIILAMFIIQNMMPFATETDPSCHPDHHNINIFYDACGYSAGHMEYILFLAGAMAVVGHMFPIWLKYKGGKGVATFMGMVLGFMATVGLITMGTWFVVAAITKRSSVAALISVALTPVYMSIFLMEEIVHVFAGDPTAYDSQSMYPLIGTVIIVGLIFYQHRENIKRLIAGTEPKINLIYSTNTKSI
jgi:acyl phosphate:glycerol-3-phosphate acyltransferase